METNFCNSCGKSDCTLQCSRCYSKYYCCVVCQTKDWLEHKKFCGKVDIINDDLLIIFYTGDPNTLFLEDTYTYQCQLKAKKDETCRKFDSKYLRDCWFFDCEDKPFPDINNNINNNILICHRGISIAITLEQINLIRNTLEELQNIRIWDDEDIQIIMTIKFCQEKQTPYIYRVNISLK